MITAMMAGVLAAGSEACAQNAQQTEPVPGKDGNKYVPNEERTGNESIVYFTRDLSPEGLRKAYEAVCGDIVGRVAVKLHTGEQNGPNIIPSSWVKELIEKDIPDATIVETNTYYVGDRYTTEQHRRTLEINGWTFCPVDIMDEEDTLTLPVNGGKWFDRMSMGSHITDYNSMVVLTHFKGHSKGGFGGSSWSFSPISRDIPREASAAAARTSASAALTAASARPGSTPLLVRTTSGISPRRSSWSA